MSGNLMTFPEYIEIARVRGISQLYFTVRRPVQYRDESGDLTDLSPTLMTGDLLEALIDQALQDIGRQQLELDGEVEKIVSASARVRCRVNIYTQRGTHAMVLTILSLETINRLVPVDSWSFYADIKDLLETPTRGLFFVNGQKSSEFVASVVQYYNETYTWNILTFGETTGFLHRHSKSTVNQREFSQDIRLNRQYLRKATGLGLDICVVESEYALKLLPELLLLVDSGCQVIIASNNSGLASVIAIALAHTGVVYKEDIALRLSNVVLLGVDTNLNTVLSQESLVALVESHVTSRT